MKGKTTKTEKTFDCVAFKRQAQTRIYKETQGMTFEEEVAYLQRRAEKGPLGPWWKRLRQTQDASRLQ